MLVRIRPVGATQPPQRPQSIGEQNGEADDDGCVGATAVGGVTGADDDGIGKNLHPGRRTYSAGPFDGDAGKPYIVEHLIADTPIGPVVCASLLERAVGNARPDEDKWDFSLYAYYEMTAK